MARRGAGKLHLEPMDARWAAMSYGVANWRRSRPPAPFDGVRTVHVDALATKASGCAGAWFPAQTAPGD